MVKASLLVQRHAKNQGAVGCIRDREEAI